MKNKVNTQNDWTFTYINYLLFLIGVITIITGYIIMYTGETESFQSVRLSPMILVIGYCVIIPISILYKSRGGSSTG
ncbi:MAG: hypothetical protein CMG64_05140 [Candidatus Marinimicrobia bacterium]|nr:hypothetical protein [Candidatus Neomarinimicrobiota bacterium]